MDDTVFVPLKMRIADLVLIYQLAQRDRRSVGDWIMECVAEKLLRMQEEWRKSREKEKEGGGS